MAPQSATNLINVGLEGLNLQDMQALDLDTLELEEVSLEVWKLAGNLANDSEARFLQQRGLNPALCSPRPVLFLGRETIQLASFLSLIHQKIWQFRTRSDCHL